MMMAVFATALTAQNPAMDTITYDFDDGTLQGWTNIIVNIEGGSWLHSDNNIGGYGYYTEFAHSGTGFVMCYSYIDDDNQLDTDAYLVSPQKYSIVNGSTLSFWADNANDDWPEEFSVCVATADVPTADDFTQIWSGGAKGVAKDNAMVRRSETRYENWRLHEIDLSAYAGQEIWIAFHDVNYDYYEIWIDDITVVIGDGSNENVIENGYNMFVTYPNPANDKIIVESQQVVNQCDIYTMTGQLVYSKPIHSESFEVMVNNLSTGTYLLRLISNDAVQTKRFVKE